jgi:hypothetical protein
MSQANTIAAADAPAGVRHTRPSVGLNVITLLFIGLVAFVAYYGQTPPAKVGADAPATAFSSARAMQQLAAIAQKPHPIGSAEHAAVRDYLVRELTAAGVAPEVQTATLVEARRRGPARAATVRNVVARLAGTAGGGKALLLASHYDTVPQSPGASDDGAAVATMLETLRALKAGPPLRNDVIFLFTDGEEAGLLGAKAFVGEHPLAKNVGLALNFEARGAGGSVWMFETSPGNGRLVGELAQAAPYPSANSLAYEIYRLMPNDTDFSVFKSARMPGLNFAYIDGDTRYHTHADSLDNVDERSVQHHGSYALSLARHFGDRRLEGVGGGGDAVYFDLLGSTLVHYPSGLVLPLTILAAVLFAGVLVLGVRRGAVRVAGVAAGFVSYLVSVVVASGVVLLAWWLIVTVQTRMGRSVLDDNYQSRFYMLGFVALTVAVAVSLQNLLLRRVSAHSLRLGALLFLLLLLVAASLILPGATYLLLWPLLFSLVAAGVLLWRGGAGPVSAVQFVVLLACAVPALILFVPMIYNVFVAMHATLLVALPLTVMLLYGLLIPVFGLMTNSRRWLLPGGAALAALALMLLGGLTGGFDKRNPNTDHVFYAMNADAGKAVWGSTDHRPDEWTSQFLGERPERGALSDFLPTTFSGFLKKEAPLATLTPASVQLIGDENAGGRRTVRLKINASSPVLNLTVPGEQASVLSSAVNGKPVEAAPGPPGQPGGPWGLQYWAPPAEGFDLTLELSAAQPFKLQVADQWYGLPDIPGASFRPRPDYLMPTPFSNSDTTLVSKSYTF